MPSPSPYRSLPAARRVALVMHAVKASRDVRAAFVERLASRRGGFRPVTLRSWSAEQLAREIVRVNAENAQDELELLQLLYVELEPETQITFLDAAGVPHERGHIDETLAPPYADAEGVRRGAAAVRAQRGDDALPYLRALARYSREWWPGIDDVVAELER